MNLPKLKIQPPGSCSAEDEPLSPAGRLFVHPELNMIIHLLIGTDNDIHVEALNATLGEVLLHRHPRFATVLIRKRGRDYWQKTDVDIDRHVVLVSTSTADEDSDRIINDYVAKLSVSVPLASDKSPCEVHLMSELQFAVFRLHHALGDGI